MADELGLVPHITLAAAADCGNGTFAVCGDEGRALWYGPFLDNDTDHPRGDRFAGAMAAANRAIWLAGRARADSGHREATLHLTVTEPDIDVVTLACAASMTGLALDIEISDDNPAVEWCQVFGKLDWSPGSLVNLVEAEATDTEVAGGTGSSGAPIPRRDPGAELRAALETLRLPEAAGLDAGTRRAVATNAHSAEDTSHGPPEAVHARRTFAAVQYGRLGALRSSARVSGA